MTDALLWAATRRPGAGVQDPGNHGPRSIDSQPCRHYHGSVQRRPHIFFVGIQRHSRLGQLAIAGECDIGGDALVVGLADERQIDGRVCRIGALHGVHQHKGRVVGIGVVDLELAGELRVIAFLPFGPALHLLDGRTAGGADYVLDGCCLARQVWQFFGAQCVTAEKLYIRQPQLFQLAKHRTGLRIEPAEKDGVRFLAFDAGQYGHEFGGLVGGELFTRDFHAFLFGRGLEHVCQALAIGSAVINDSRFLELACVVGINGQRRAERVVVGDQAERRFVAGLGQVRVGGGSRDVRQAAFAVNGRCGKLVRDCR